MRGVLVLALVGACGFEHGIMVPDAAPPDVKPDVIVPTWQIDDTSKKGVPAAVFEWTELAKSNGITVQPPDDLWLMQESTGALQDSIGSVQLTPQNNPSYRNSVLGWSRVAAGTYDTVANQGFVTTATGNLNGPAYLMLVYVAVTSPPSGNRSLIGIGAGPDHRYVAITPTPVFQGTGTGVVPTSGTIDPMTTVHPLVLKLDPSQTAYVVYTDQEKLSVSWTGTGGTGALLMVGNAIIGAASARYLYGALWTGSKAQLGDADVKKLLGALGWTVTGY